MEPVIVVLAEGTGVDCPGVTPPSIHDRAHNPTRNSILVLRYSASGCYALAFYFLGLGTI